MLGFVSSVELNSSILSEASFWAAQTSNPQTTSYWQEHCKLEYPSNLQELNDERLDL
jgi:hypothetical protein